MTQILEQLSQLIQSNFYLAPLLALLAGIATSLTPCALSSIPLVIGYVGGVADGKEMSTKKSFKLSVCYAIGLALTFTILGTLAATLGRLMGTSSSIWYLLLGVLMILMALQTFEIYQFIPSMNLMTKNKKIGYSGAVLTGVLGGIFSSPCATPVLVVLLGIVAQNGNPLFGMLLLLIYSVGHSLLVIIAGTSMGFVKRITQNPHYETQSKLIKIGMGTVILCIGFYMFYLGF